MERVHQVILNMLDAEDLDNNFFNHIDPWGETLSYIACAIIDSYHSTILDTPVQAVFVIDMIFNLVSVVY